MSDDVDELVEEIYKFLDEVPSVTVTFGAWQKEFEPGKPIRIYYERLSMYTALPDFISYRLNTHHYIDGDYIARAGDHISIIKEDPSNYA